jgi:hypothetical protein
MANKNTQNQETNFTQPFTEEEAAALQLAGSIGSLAAELNYMASSAVADADALQDLEMIIAEAEEELPQTNELLAKNSYLLVVNRDDTATLSAAIVNYKLILDDLNDGMDEYTGYVTTTLENIDSQIAAFNDEATSVDNLISSIEQLNSLKVAHHEYTGNNNNGGIGSPNGTSDGVKVVGEGVKSLVDAGIKNGGAEISAGLGMLGGFPGVAIGFMATEVAQQIAGTIKYHDAYVNAYPEQQKEMDKQAIISDMRALNNFSFLPKNKAEELATITAREGDEEKDYDPELPTNVTPHSLGTDHPSLGEVIQAYPDLVNDATFTKPIEYALTVKGDPTLIDAAHTFGLFKNLSNPTPATWGEWDIPKIIDPFSNDPIIKNIEEAKNNKAPTGSAPATHTPSAHHTAAPQDHITGQRVVTYNIKMGDLIGQKINTQTVNGSKEEIAMSAQYVARLLAAVANDSELHNDD